MKTHYTRKNFIAIGITIFYVLFSFFAALLIDGANPLGLNPKMNVIAKLADSMYDTASTAPAWILTSIVLLYIVIGIAAFIFEMRVAAYYEGKIGSKKWIIIYVATLLGSLLVSFGIGLVAQYPYQPNDFINSLMFLVESMLMGLMMFSIAFVLIGSIAMLVINFKNVDKPFRFFKKSENEDMATNEVIEKEAEKQLEMGSLAESFGEESKDAKGSFNPSNSNITVVNNSNEEVKMGSKEKVFPGLSTIDVIESARRDNSFDDNIDLANLCVQFRNYLAKEEKLYFSIDTIRAFIAGLAASRIIILEGLSGTGKSSLARYFSEFINEESYFEPVQATWRDRTSLLGFYNDFSRSYNETEFLKRLYKANYRNHHVNIMALDEINISRVEYYFADFLSILEYPRDKWKLKIMQLPYDFEAPKMLEDGVLKIPENTWFIGTANKDDSTYTITDKVYDRAITIAFDDRNEEFSVKEDVKKVSISFDHLEDLFNKAIEVKENNLNANDKKAFKTLTDFTYDTFDLTFGNRINAQIEALVPVYVACGGSKEDALDFMFSRKVVAKLTGRFEDYVKQGLIDLKSLIAKKYGEKAFPLTVSEINKLLKRL